MNDPTETAMAVYYDKPLDLYGQFYDHSLAKKLDALTTGTKLQKAAEILCGTWKAASNTMRLPWLAVTSIEQIGMGAVSDTTLRQSFLNFLPGYLNQKLSIPKGLGFV